MGEKLSWVHNAMAAVVLVTAGCIDHGSNAENQSKSEPAVIDGGQLTDSTMATPGIDAESQTRTQDG